MSILAIQPSSKCDASCVGCPWMERFGCAGVMLPLDAMEVLKTHLGDFKFDECIIMCPNPFLHPKIDTICEKTDELCRKKGLFLPSSISRNMLKRASLENFDSISLLVSSFREIKHATQTLKMMLSQGIDNLEAYIILDSSYDFAEILSIIKLCSSFGLPITIGPRMYDRPYTSKLVEELAKKENVEIGLHYGRKYFYNALKAFINNYPVTILTSSSRENCRSLYLNPYGNFLKCPLSHYEISYRAATREDIRKMLFSPCPLGKDTLSFSPRVEVFFMTNKGVKIPADILELLEVISQVNSFRAACKTLGVSPSTYWEKIKNMEEKLGVPLVISTKGGRKKGTTILTGFAKELLEEYKRVREKIITSINEHPVLIDLHKP